VPSSPVATTFPLPIYHPLPFLDYVSFSHVSRRLTEAKWEESKKEIKEMGKKSKHSYRYDLVKRGGNSAVMGEKQTIAARFYQLKSGHALIAKYLMRIGKRRDMKCWLCGHEYQTRDHLFIWCKRWKREQKRLWVDGQEVEDGYEGVEKVLEKPKISLPMSLVFAEEKCSRALMDFLSCTDVGRISRVVEEAENSDYEESSDGGGVKVNVVFWRFLLLNGEEDLRLCFCFFMLLKKRGGNMYGICHGRQWPNAI